ncbi:hypothetical protein ACET3X_006149 [Alternaria dauci]|uniref:Cell wall protein n=1 Tax=Alternaria dauci TaxID=48095 RepID=A0ABR3UHS5_9PLEO
MKFLAIIVAAQLATALPVAKEACAPTDITCSATKANPQIFDVASQQLDNSEKQLENAPVRSIQRDVLKDALAGLDTSAIPAQAGSIPAGSSKRDVVTPTPEDATEAGPDMYEEAYEMVPEATEDTYGEVLPEVSDDLSKKSLEDDLELSETTPEFEDSYAEFEPEATHAAYEVVDAAYEAKPTPVEVHSALPTPHDVYEAAPTPSKVYGAAPTPVKPSKVYEAIPTPVKTPSYEALPTPVKEATESSPLEDTYDALGLDLGIFRKN